MQSVPNVLKAHQLYHMTNQDVGGQRFVFLGNQIVDDHIWQIASLCPLPMGAQERDKDEVLQPCWYGQDKRANEAGHKCWLK